jgi:hypothetical protein
MAPARERQMTGESGRRLTVAKRRQGVCHRLRELAQQCFVARPMTDEAHARYFADREQAERTLGNSARNWRVAAIHTEMAERYEALAKVFGAKPHKP